MQVPHCEQEAIVISGVYLKNQDSSHTYRIGLLHTYTDTHRHTNTHHRRRQCRQALPLISSLPAFVEDSCCFAHPGICLLVGLFVDPLPLWLQIPVPSCLTVWTTGSQTLGQAHPEVKCPTCLSCKYVITPSPQCGERKEVTSATNHFRKPPGWDMDTTISDVNI